MIIKWIPNTGHGSVLLCHLSDQPDPVPSVHGVKEGFSAHLGLHERDLGPSSSCTTEAKSNPGRTGPPLIKNLV